MKHFIFTLFFIGGLVFACSDDDSSGNDPDDNPFENHHLQSVGDSSNELLSEEDFDQLVVELVYVDGYEPTSETIENLKDFLSDRLYKSNGINVSSRSISSPGLAPYSVNDIRQVEEDNRTSFTTENRLTVFAFFADGNYSDNENVLGVAYQNTSVALFEEKINELSGGIGQPSQTMVESTVFQHEFGHIMGLVDIGAPMQTDHKDDEHGNHCDVESCLMYYTAETGDIVSNLIGLSDVPSLDNQCLADLQANGGK